MPRRTAAALALSIPTAALAGTLVAHAHAQCEPEWLGGHAVPGLNGTVYASIVWDRPGTGPVLVLGGQFSAAGDVQANGVALWDGRVFEALGGGIAMQGPPLPSTGVLATDAYGGDLIVGGVFSSAGGAAASNIARWDGSRWHALGEGVGGRWAGSGPGVAAMAEYNGKLFVGGAFDHAGGSPAESIATWDGSNWDPLLPGITPRPFFPGAVINAMLVHGGDLYVSGRFGSIGGRTALNIARWDGQQWHSLADGIEWEATAMTHFQGGIAVNGTVVGGSSTFQRISVWDGQSWSSISGRFLSHQQDGRIRALREVDGDLLVGGGFISVAGQSAHNIARWDGESWSQFEGGVNASVYAITPMGDDLILGGSMLRTGPGEGISAQHAARWDGNRWHALSPGTNSVVYAIAEHNGETIIGGNFREVQGVDARYIAASDGSSWRPLGEGMDGRVLHLESYGGDLYAAGAFDTAGGEPAHRIARWDGTRWDNPGAGPGTFINDMLQFEGELIAGGSIVDSAGVAIGNIAAWDGSRWRMVGNTFGVNALGAHAGTLYAASGADILRRVGSSWEPIGAIVAPWAGGVRAIAGYGNDLFVAGTLTSVGGVPAENIARWDGLQWNAAGAGLDRYANTMAAFRGELIVGGGLLRAGAAEVRGIARWDGRRWAPMNEGLTHGVNNIGIVHALHAGRELLVGGNFHTAGPHVASRFARWGCPCYADCDNSGTLDFFDFLCFQNEFLAGAPYADCDRDGTLTFFDFLCFQNEFLAGCP